MGGERRRPNHSLGAALALGAFLAAHAVCWTFVLTREARPLAAEWPAGNLQLTQPERTLP